MPLFLVYPAESSVLKQLLNVLGEPKSVEVGLSVKGEMFRELLKPDDVSSLTIQYDFKPTAERALELYRKYYESYVNAVKMKRPRVEEKLRTVSHFKASWYIDGLSAEFDGFKLKISVQENIEKTVEIMQLFREMHINMEVDLSKFPFQKTSTGRL